MPGPVSDQSAPAQASPLQTVCCLYTHPTYTRDVSLNNNKAHRPLVERTEGRSTLGDHPRARLSRQSGQGVSPRQFWSHHGFNSGSDVIGASRFAPLPVDSIKQVVAKNENFRASKERPPRGPTDARGRRRCPLHKQDTQVSRKDGARLIAEDFPFDTARDKGHGHLRGIAHQ